MQSAESNQTVETLLALAYPHGEAPEFITPELRQEFSDIAATARKEHEKTFNWRDQMHAAFTRRENEAAAAVLTIDELIKLDADALVLRWNARQALIEACSWLCDEIEAAEKAVLVLEAQYKAAEDLACLASMPEGSTPADLAAHRERQAQELAARDEERRRAYEARIATEEKAQAKAAQIANRNWYTPAM